MAMALRVIAALSCLLLGAAGAAQPFGVKPGCGSVKPHVREHE
jgi:hypothetical protein